MIEPKFPLSPTIQHNPILDTVLNNGMVAVILWMFLVTFIAFGLSLLFPVSIFLPIFLTSEAILLLAMVAPIARAYSVFRAHYRGNVTARLPKPVIDSQQQSAIFLTFLGLLLSVSFTCVTAFSNFWGSSFLSQTVFLGLNFQTLFIAAGIIGSAVMLLWHILVRISYPIFTSRFIMHLRVLEILATEDHSIFFENRYQLLFSLLTEPDGTFNYKTEAGRLSFQRLFTHAPSSAVLSIALLGLYQNIFQTNKRAQKNFEHLIVHSAHPAQIIGLVWEMWVKNSLADERIQLKFVLLIDCMVKEGGHLFRLNHPQANFERLMTLFWNPLEEAWIFNALSEMNSQGLLTGAHAQANFDSLMAVAAGDIRLNASQISELCRTLSEMGRQGLLTATFGQMNFRLLMANAAHAEWINKVLRQMALRDLLTPEHAQANFRRLMAHAAEAESINGALSEMGRQGLLTKEFGQTNFALLIDKLAPATQRQRILSQGVWVWGDLLRPEDAQAKFRRLMAHAAEALSEMGQQGLLTRSNGQKNFTLLMAHVAHAEPIGEILILMRDKGLTLGEPAQANFVRLLDHAAWIKGALSIMDEGGLLSRAQAQANFNRLMTHVDTAKWIQIALSNMQQGGLLTEEKAQENFDLLMDQATYAEGISNSLERIRRQNLLASAHAQANFECLMTHAAHAHNIDGALNTMARTGLMSVSRAQENFNRLMDQPDYAGSISDALITMHQKNLLAGEHGQANFEALIVHAEDAWLIRSILRRCLPFHISPESFGRLASNAPHLSLIKDILVVIFKYGREYRGAVPPVGIRQAKFDMLMRFVENTPAYLPELLSGLKALDTAGLLTTVAIPRQLAGIAEDAAASDLPSLTWAQYYLDWLSTTPAGAGSLGRGVALLQRERPEILLAKLPILRAYPAQAESIAALYAAHLVDDTAEEINPLLASVTAMPLAAGPSLGRCLGALQCAGLLNLPNFQALQNKVPQDEALPDCIKNVADLAPILALLQRNRCLNQGFFDQLINWLKNPIEPIKDKAEDKTELADEKRAAVEDAAVSRQVPGIFDALRVALEHMESADSTRPAVQAPYFNSANIQLLLNDPLFPQSVLVQLGLKPDLKQEAHRTTANIQHFAEATFSQKKTASERKESAVPPSSEPSSTLLSLPTDVLHNMLDFLGGYKSEPTLMRSKERIKTTLETQANTPKKL